MKHNCSFVSAAWNFLDENSPTPIYFWMSILFVLILIRGIGSIVIDFYTSGITMLVFLFAILIAVLLGYLKFQKRLFAGEKPFVVSFILVICIIFETLFVFFVVWYGMYSSIYTMTGLRVISGIIAIFSLFIPSYLLAPLLKKA